LTLGQLAATIPGPREAICGSELQLC
jgi:hypothetical protein